jgi:hypothetical protein
MPNTSRRLWISIFVIGIAACLCLSVLSLGAAGYMLLYPTTRSNHQATAGPQTAVAVNPTPDRATPTLPQSTSSATLPASTSSPSATVTYAPVSADIARQMDQIQQQVSQITGLQASQPVTRVLITPAQLAQRVTSDFAKQNDPKEILTNETELIAWGLIKPGFDFNNYMEILQKEEIAGFYDDKSKEMFVVSGAGFGGNEKWTYAHEYTHALQDQNFDIEHGLNYNDQTCKKASERCAAVQALLEGDAVLSQYDWLATYASNQDKKDILSYANSLSLPVYDQAPDFLKQDFNFPYQQGLDFVQSLFKKGGWAAIDQAFKNPPVSTSQILHPELYPDQKPISVTLPDISSALGPGWSLLEQNSLGEWYTYLILGHGIDPKTRLDDNTAKAAAQGWAGDTYLTYYNDRTKNTVIVLRTAWDSTSDAQQFAAAFQTYSNDRFGTPTSNTANASSWSSDGVYSEFHLSGGQTTWIYTPDASSAQAIWETLQVP